MTPSLATLAGLGAAALVAVALGLAVLSALRSAGRDAERAEDERRDAAAARKQLDDARAAEEVRRETDRGDFGDAVDRL